MDPHLEQNSSNPSLTHHVTNELALGASLNLQNSRDESGKDVKVNQNERRMGGGNELIFCDNVSRVLRYDKTEQEMDMTPMENDEDQIEELFPDSSPRQKTPTPMPRRLAGLVPTIRSLSSSSSTRSQAAQLDPIFPLPAQKNNIRLHSSVHALFPPNLLDLNQALLQTISLQEEDSRPSISATDLLNGQALALQRAGDTPESDDHLRSYMLASSLPIRGFSANQRIQAEVAPRQPPTPEFKSLALGKLKRVGNQEDCHFCHFETEFGISDPSLWLPTSASCGFCMDCYNSGDEFPEKWYYTDTKRPMDPGKAILHGSQWIALKEATRGCGQRPLKQTFLDGKDVTQFMPPCFCRGCPWRQLDVKLALICDDCRYQKLSILKHRHTKWLPIVEEAVRLDLDSGSHLRRCMICTNHAVEICVECPLRVCSTCSTLLDILCKGSVTNLLYHYGRSHIRNDAFLLRSDGGGF